MRGAARTRRLVVAVLALVSGVTAVATAHVALAASSKPGPFADGKYFIVVCGASHRNDDDAIALPGQPGRSHNHTYVGNRSTDARSTPESLRVRVRTTCEPTADASAYWVPTLYSRGRAVVPLVALVYYVRRTTATVQPVPAGLEIIAGNARAMRPQSPDVAYWTCGSPLATAVRFPHVPNCAVSRGVNLTVSFPDCWDGRRLDSPDHKRHMAYSRNRRCPGSHPVAVPTMRLLVVYPAVRGGTIASGRYSAHADFMNGWEQDFLGDRVRGLND